VADVIQVEPKYEQAVEAVLADKLQYIIVESQEDGRLAVDYLKKKARGRGSFIPLKELQKNIKDCAQGSQFPLLLDLISAPETHIPVIQALLGDTVLVETLEQAVSAWKKNGRDLCFVTVDGDMVDQRGVISGGRLASSSRGLLARKREMEELKEKSVTYQKKVNELKVELENIIAEIQKKKEALQNLTEDKWNCQEEINEFDKMLFRFGQELDQLEKLSQKISTDLEIKGREQHKHKENLLKIEEELRQCKVKLQEEEDYFQKKEAELNESEQEFDQFRDELTKLKADYRILKEEQRSLTREMERLKDYASDSLKRLEKIEEDISLGQLSRDDCQRKRDDFREELGELNEVLKEAEEAVNLADRERQTFQQGIREEEAKEHKVRGAIEVLKEKINRDKMEHSEIHFKMNNLAEMVKEKSNLDLPAIYVQYLDEDFSKQEVEERLEYKKALRQRLGEVNLTAIKEHEALKERYEFISNQREDLISSIESLRIAIRKLNKTSLEKFTKAFHDVDRKLKEIFPILFKGGTAGLRLTDEARPLESGVLVEVQPPGKRLSHMGLLSGGEKALVAMALVFSIYMIKPSPFCLLDEVDAPLDEANIDRFNSLLKEIKKASQIIMVTHSRRTMEIVDRLYGITMEKAGISQMVSVDIQGMKNQVLENRTNGQPTAH
jgi:chromosome segregation protein